MGRSAMVPSEVSYRSHSLVEVHADPTDTESSPGVYRTFSSSSTSEPCWPAPLVSSANDTLITRSLVFLASLLRKVSYSKPYSGCIANQSGLGYGLLFDLSFFLRNLSVVGGLLMVLSDTLQNKKKLFAGIPSLSETDRRK